MGDTNAIPTGVWIRAELVDELRTCLTNHVETACMCIDAARAVVDAVKTEDETVPNVLTGERVKPWRTPAHMAAPDELTALRQKVAESCHKFSNENTPDRCDTCGAWADAEPMTDVERIASGERVRALRDENTRLAETLGRVRGLLDDPTRLVNTANLRAALGDA